MLSEIFKQKLISLYPEFDKVNGPYDRKDGRQHIILNNTNLANGIKGKTKTISYPKAIIEVELKRRLSPNETVDHIDKNPLNNNLCNLQVLSRKAHVLLDAKRRKPIIVNCTICGKLFEANRGQLRKDKSGFFCSRSCSGKYGAEIQNGRRVKVEKVFNVEYYCNKNTPTNII